MALSIFVFLLFTLAIARRFPHGFLRLSDSRPLDVDKNLPFPEAGYGSSILSLTALFGPYLTMYLLFGLPSVIGLAAGTIIGLFLVQKEIDRHESTSFQEFLVRKLKGSDGSFLLILFSIVHLGLAASELIIIDSVFLSSMALSVKYSSLLTLSIAIVGYYYCIDGGYLSIYRTDVLQYIFILAMGLVLFFLSISEGSFHLKSTILGLSPTTWIGEGSCLAGAIALNFFVGAVMGVLFISCSIDTIKRVFVLRKTRNKKSMLWLIVSGMIPFVLIIPMANISTSFTSYDTPPVVVLLKSLSNNSWVFITVVIGVISSFLSSFDSSLISASHVILIFKSKSSYDSRYESKGWFYIVAGCCFMLVSFIWFVSFWTKIHNPYLIATLLIGPYVTLSGALVGTNMLTRRIKLFPLLIISIVVNIFWVIHVSRIPNIKNEVGLHQLSMIPHGVYLALAVSIVIYALSMKEKKNGDH